MARFSADSPKNSDAFFKAIIRDKCAANIEELEGIAHDKDVRPADRIVALKSLIEWAIGKPKQEVDNNVAFTTPIVFSNILSPEQIEDAANGALPVGDDFEDIVEAET